MTKKRRGIYISSIAIVATLLLGFTAGAANAASLTNNNYHAYSNPAQGADTISPFAVIFGAIGEQDPNGTADETTISLYDFRGLSSAPVAGQTYFFLEDIHDGQFDVPGVTMTASSIVRTDDGRNGSNNSGGNCDNIDEDDGACDGSIGYPRGSMRSPTRFDFNVGVLGDLPTHVGIALAGDANYVTINAHNSGGALLETATAYHDGGKTAFAGVITTEGIAYVTIAGGTESDHFQYGRLGVADTTPPVIATFSPTNGATGAAPYADLVAGFNENVQKGIGNIVIKELVGGAVVETIDVTSGSVTISGTDVTIDPVSVLAVSTGYYVEIVSGAIKDLAGLDFSGISGDSTWSFTTEATTPPTISTLSPTNGAPGAAPYADLVAGFNEGIQKGTGNIVIKELIGGGVVETIDIMSGSVTISGAEVTIAGGGYFEVGVGYYVEIDSGAIEDLAGTAFAGISGNSTWGFTIAPAVETFTVAMLPDTQHYSDSATRIVHFNNQTQWIIDNHVADNIVMVSHVGDIVEVGSNVTMWDRADAAMGILDTDPNLPYGAVLGNHDIASNDDASNYITYFGAARFAGRPWSGGASPDGRNQFHRFSAGGRGYLHLVLEHRAASSGNAAEVVSWAQGVLDANSGQSTILSTHEYLASSGGRTGTGNAIFAALVKGNPQVFMTLSGHVEGEGHSIASNDAGQDVFQIVANFQSRPNGGDGWLSLIQFDEDNDAINVTTYSPSLAQWETDANSQYSFSMDFDARLGPVNTGPQLWSPSVASITGDGATVQCQLINADADDVTLVWAHADQGETTVSTWTAASGGGSYSFGTASKDEWLSRVLSGLDVDTPYSFRFLATAGADSDWSAAISFATDGTSPSITSLSPSNGADDAAPNGSLIMRFDEDIRKGSGNIVIKASADNSVVQTLDVGSDDVLVSGSVVTVFLPADLALTTGYYVEIDSGAIEDLVGNLHASFSWNFTTTVYTMVFSQDSYHSYSDSALGVGTISPFASVFGAISEQDPNGTTGESDISLYDFRGLTAAPVPGQPYFFLEDVHDGQFDSPGITVVGMIPRTEDGRNGSNNGGHNTDSIDEDDGAVDGAFGNPRGSLRVGSGERRITFDEGVLGALPTHVGLVATGDGVTCSISAYDSDDNLLETASITSAFSPTDAFAGVIIPGGINYIIVNAGAAEWGHLQYGFVVPTSGTLILVK